MPKFYYAIVSGGSAVAIFNTWSIELGKEGCIGITGFLLILLMDSLSNLFGEGES